MQLGIANELLLKSVAKKLAREGIKQLIIDITGNGEFNIDTVYSQDDRKTVVNTETYRYLTDFFNSNKPKL